MKIVYQANDTSLWGSESEALARDRQLVVEAEIMKLLEGSPVHGIARCIYENRETLVDLLTEKSASANVKYVAANEVLKHLKDLGGYASDKALRNQLGDNAVSMGIPELVQKGQVKATPRGWTVVNPNLTKYHETVVLNALTSRGGYLSETELVKQLGEVTATEGLNSLAQAGFIKKTKWGQGWTICKTKNPTTPNKTTATPSKTDIVFRYLPTDGSPISYGEIKTFVGFDPGPQLANLMSQGRVLRPEPGKYKVYLRTPIVSDQVVAVKIQPKPNYADTILTIVQEAAQKGSGVPLKTLYDACGVHEPGALKKTLERLVKAQKIVSVHKGFYATPNLGMKRPVKKMLRVTKAVMSQNPRWKRVLDAVTTTVTTRGVADHIGVTSAEASYYLNALAKNKRIRKVAKGRWDVA